MQITVTNRSGAGIDRVELNTITGPLGNLRVKIVRVDGAEADATVDDQTIKVQLGGVLPDDATAVIRVRIRASIPSTLGGSNWMFTRVGSILQANRWIPWVGLHRPFDRPNHGDPFFTALSPHVTVRITTDRKLKIATPGHRVACRWPDPDVRGRERSRLPDRREPELRGPRAHRRRPDAARLPPRRLPDGQGPRLDGRRARPR